MNGISIAIMTDVHANLPALQAVLGEVDRIGCDLIYHTGDSIAIGPFPHECLDLLLNRTDTRVLMGNHERYQINGIPNPRPKYMSDGEIEHHMWTKSQLDEQQLWQLKLLPYVSVIEIGGIRAGFVHSRLREDGYDFTNIESESTDDLDAYFSFIPADIVFYGHIHKPSRVNGEKEYVNPGSVGCTKDSMSRFCILRIRNGSYKLESHETKYNKSVVFRELENRKVPDRQFIARTFYGYS